MIFQNMLSAVSYIRSGFIHRDIKPENILIRRNHEGKTIYYLADFGLVGNVLYKEIKDR